MCISEIGGKYGDISVEPKEKNIYLSKEITKNEYYEIGHLFFQTCIF